jgi:Xaa-Pro aminopeptidase
MTVSDKLIALRQQMHIHNIDAYIVPSSDPHLSEYFADRYKSRHWLSGFMGSAGTVVVTADHAGVWTDSRYYTQCAQQIAGTPFEMHKQAVQGAPEHIDWLEETMSANNTVGCDSQLFSVGQIRSMQKAFDKKSIKLVTNADLIEPIWKDRPSLPTAPIFEHEVHFTGKTRGEKLADIRQKMVGKGANYHLVTTFDDIGWTLNLRGSDVECNPVFIAYLVIGLDSCSLFVDSSKVSETLKNTLNTEGVFLHRYDSIDAYLAKLKANDTIVVDDANANFALYSTIKKAKIVEEPTFSILMKAVKNPTEQDFIRQVMVKDGVALTKSFMWLEQTLEKQTVTEYEVASMIAQYRSDQANYYGESFDAIIGYKDNGAIMHYKPEAHNSATIEKSGILLLDSGGQYADGTTDITRTISLDGKPTATQKRDFTLVLKGHIGLAMLKFPEGTKGIQMDILARQHLWQYGLNFGHGTGHGVGYFMNVHEPPQGFVTGWNARGKTEQMVGMLTSNEPGFYKVGEYGIRIENLVLVVEAEETDFGKFRTFETVTLFPMDAALIDKKLLTDAEIKWLNQYHKRVYKALKPHLNKVEKAWLKEKCAKI